MSSALFKKRTITIRSITLVTGFFIVLVGCRVVDPPNLKDNIRTQTTDQNKDTEIDQPVADDDSKDKANDELQGNPAIAPECTRSIAGTANNSALKEVSGIDISLDNNDNIYVHNDSGGTPHLFRLDAKGQLQETIYVNNAGATDWEDLSVGPCDGKSCIYIADFGQQ